MTIPTPIRVVAAVALLFVTAGADVAGQVPADTARIADLIVTGTAVPVRPDALTAAVTVLSGDDLRVRGIRLVLDALREVPGFAMVQQGSFGAVTSAFVRGGESDYVKVLVDGVAANLPGGSFDFASLTTDNVERIEVVRGPSSVVHGSEAVTGVVQIVTRGGGGPLQASATAEGGTFGSTAFDGSVSGGSPRFGWSAGASRFASAGTYAFNNDFENLAGSVRVRATLDNRSSMSLSARYGANTTHFPTDGSGSPSDSNQVSRGHALTLGLDAARRLGAALEARLLLSLSGNRYEFDDRSDVPGDTVGFAYASERRLDAGRSGADARLSVRIAPSATITAGSQLELEREAQRGTFTSNFGAGAYTEAQAPLDAHRRTVAGYVQGTAELPRGLALTGGLRLDDSETFGSFVTYRAGMSYRLESATRVRLSLGTAFKSPSIAENYADSPFEVGNRALEPERTRSWEVGVEQGIADGMLTLSAAYFDQHFRNLIQYVGAAPGEPTYRNLGAATARGAELAALLRPTTGLSIEGQYTWLLTEVTDAGASASPTFADGQRLLRRPPHSGRLSAGWRPGNRAFLSTAVQIVGRRDDVDFSTFARVTLPAYATLDLSAALRVLGPRTSPSLTLLLRLENAFDEEYETVVGFPGRGRMLMAGGRIER